MSLGERSTPEIEALYARLDGSIARSLSPLSEPTSATMGKALESFDVVRPYVDMSDAEGSIKLHDNTAITGDYPAMLLEATPSGELWAIQRHATKPFSGHSVPLGVVAALEASPVNWVALDPRAQIHRTIGQAAPADNNAYWRVADRVGGIVSRRLSEFLLRGSIFHERGAYYIDTDGVERHISGKYIENGDYDDRQALQVVAHFHPIQYAKVEVAVSDDPVTMVKHELLAGALKSVRRKRADDYQLRRCIAYAEKIGVDALPYVEFIGELSVQASALSDIGLIRHKGSFFEKALERMGEQYGEKQSQNVSPIQGVSQVYSKIVHNSFDVDRGLAKHLAKSIKSPVVRVRLMTEIGIKAGDEALFETGLNLLTSHFVPEERPAMLTRLYHMAREYDTDHASRILEMLPPRTQLRLQERLTAA